MRALHPPLGLGLLLSLLLSWQASVHAQATQATQTTQTTQATQTAENRAVLDGQSVSSQRAQLMAVISAAEAEGLPVAPLLAKVREGVAKRVAAERIAQAVTALHARMQGADRLLSQAPRAPQASRHAAIVALVDALNAGLSQTDLNAVLTALGPAARDLDAVRQAAVTLAELAERGFGPSAAVSATTLAWRRGGLRAVQGVVTIAAGLSPSLAARDAALVEGVTNAASSSHVAPGQANSAAVRAREPGPPHDDAFETGQSRGRGKAKGRSR